MVEAASALGLLALLVVGLYAGIQVNERMLQHFVAQREALDVLENVVERAAAEAPLSTARCRELLADELAQSPLAGRPSVQATCDVPAGGGIRCTIRNRERLLAEIRMGSHEN